MAKALQISSSTVQKNIINRFSETGEISVCQGQGRNPLLDARGLQALRQHCITHLQDCVDDITKWAQKYFQKLLSVTTIHRSICRCQLKLNHAKRKPYSNMVQKCCRILWTKTHFIMDCFNVRKCSMLSPNLTFIVGSHVHCVLLAKEEGDLPPYYQRSVLKPASLMVWECISTYCMGSLHVLDGTMNAERYKKVLKQYMLPSRQYLFQGRPCSFSRTIQNHILQLLQQHGFALEESTC